MDEYSIESHQARHVRYLFGRLRRRARQRRAKRLNDQKKKLKKPNIRNSIKWKKTRERKKRTPKKWGRPKNRRKPIVRKKLAPKRCTTVDPSTTQDPGDPGEAEDTAVASTGNDHSSELRMNKFSWFPIAKGRKIS